MKISDMKESKYLKKEDVGQGKLLTINSLRQENVALESQPEELKYIMFFKEETKGVVMNWTNIQLCANATGSEDTDEWPGKQVVLYNDPNVSFAGKITGGIRIRAPRNQQPPADYPQLQPTGNNPLDDDIPF